VSEQAYFDRLESSRLEKPEYRVTWLPAERLPASVPRHLSGGAVSGHFGEREDLVQPAQSKDRSPLRYLKVDADTGEEVANEDIVKGYMLDKETFIEVSKEELEEVALESTRTIDIDEFVEREEIDPRYLIRPYYLRPDGKVGHDAFAVIRDTIREMNKVAIGRVVLTNRALEPLDKGLVGTLLRYPYEVCSEEESFDEIQDVKVTKDMLDLAKHS
jgi:Ku protein